MERVLVGIYDLRRFRDNLVNEIKEFVPEHFEAHAPSFTRLTTEEIAYLDNMDKFREAATKYATGTLKTENPHHITAVKQYIKMEMLDLAVRNERVALLDEITRCHAMLNNVTTNSYPEARFVYTDTLNYTPYISVLNNDSL